MGKVQKNKENGPTFDAFIMAAGRGTRMRSELPKVLHPLCGWSLLRHVLEALRGSTCRRIYLIVGHRHQDVEAAIASWSLGSGLPEIKFVLQAEAKGTGDAVRSAWQSLTKEKPEKLLPILVLSGDTPLIDAELINEVLAAHRLNGGAAALASMRVTHPRGYGRVVTAGGKVIKIVEEKDATPAERELTLVNGGVYAFAPDFLGQNLPALKPSPVSGEYYLTDLVELAVDQGSLVQSVEVNSVSLQGVNDLEQLADAAKEVRRRRLRDWLRNGVIVHDPRHTYPEMDVRAEAGAVIEANVYLLGNTSVASGAWIEAGSRLENAEIGRGARVRMNSVVTEARVGEGAVIGPMAHLRPGSDVGQKAKIGNFVELKKTTIGARSKVSHLSYLGDASVGEDVNIGCGFITCNFDGIQKHRTEIGDRAFVGSDVQAVAPIKIASDSYVASGTTLTRNVEQGDLAIARSRQENKAGYAERLKQVKSRKLQTGRNGD